MEETKGSVESMGIISVSVEVPYQRSSDAGKGNGEKQGQELKEQRSIIQMAPPASSSSSSAPKPQRRLARSQQRLEDKPKGKVKRRFNCTVENCHYSTPYSKDLARHMRKHTGEKPFSCDRCSKSYSRYDKLLMHTRIHDGVRPFKCKVCDYATVDSGSLRKHQRVHTDERPYKCQLCPYAAKESSQLVVHLRTHTGDSPYFCVKEGCDAAFKTPSDLQRHARLHTGEKPYSCPHPDCSYSAAVKSNLNVHIRKHHSKQKDTLLSTNERTSSDLSTISESSSSGFNSCNSAFDSNKNENEPEVLVLSASNGSFPSTEGIDPIVLMDESGQEITVPAPGTKVELTSIKNITPVKSHCEENASEGSSSSLPFQYACKQCSYKADTLKLFAVHMKKSHEDTEKSFKIIKPKSKGGGGKVGRPRPTRRTKGVSGQTSTGGNLEKFYDCTFCSASFVREDSLRCHMRQHASSNSFGISSVVQNRDRLFQNSRSNGSDVEVMFAHTHPSFCYQVPSNSNLIPNFTNSVSQPDHNRQHGIQVASVITQNPAVINNNTNISASSTQHHQIYLISPGGNTIHPIEPVHEEYIIP